MRSWRVLPRAVAAILVTGIAALIPFVARALTFGSTRASAFVGSRACRAWGWLTCRILGVRVTADGPRPRGLFLVACNHLSYLDILVLSSLYPSTFVAKREIASWPVFGWIARGAGTIFVDRERPRDVVRVGREMTSRLRAGVALTLFPEGRSTPGSEVLPFQPSLLEPAAAVGVPCFAVALTYETPGVSIPPSVTVCWYDRMDFVSHIVRLMRIPRIEARVRFAGPPVVSTDRKTLATRLETSVRTVFEPVRQAASTCGGSP